MSGFTDGWGCDVSTGGLVDRTPTTPVPRFIHNGVLKDLADAQALSAKLQKQLDAANQTSGMLCPLCGWRMKFPDEPCRCELEKELAKANEALGKLYNVAAKLKEHCEEVGPFDFNIPDSVWVPFVKAVEETDSLMNGGEKG